LLVLTILQLIVGLIAVLKAEILQLIEFIGTVKIWIQLNIPRIEDGNNFGVSIQEETVNELSRAEVGNIFINS
jgi:proteasome activator subunit 2 (PA28 beta)